jgi:hypothetical protein
VAGRGSLLLRWLQLEVLLSHEACGASMVLEMKIAAVTGFRLQ